MCSYSTINGNYACQNQYLLTDVLKQEWDFPCYFNWDYGALHSTTGGAFAGLDEEQPFNTFFGSAARYRCVKNETIPQAVMNTMVQRILTQMFTFNLFELLLTGTPQTPRVTTPAHQQVGTDVADTAATLLKNKPHTLPLSANHAGNVAVIGPAASTQPLYGGGG